MVTTVNNYNKVPSTIRCTFTDTTANKYMQTGKQIRTYTNSQNYAIFIKLMFINITRITCNIFTKSSICI